MELEEKRDYENNEIAQHLSEELFSKLSKEYNH